MSRPTIFALALAATFAAIAIYLAPSMKVDKGTGTLSIKKPSIPKPVDSKSFELEKRLASQLQIRFHDLTDPDFGYGRVTEPGARLHPSVFANQNRSETEMAKYDKKYEEEYKDHPDEVLDDNFQWQKGDDSDYERFRAENATEKSIIADAESRNLQIAVFTAGIFEQGHFARLKGPAFVQTPTTPSLKLNQVKEWASKEYTTDAKSYSGNVAGWKVYAERVFADNAKCINCHMDSEDERVIDNPHNVKMGSSLGLFIIATRSRTVAP